MSASFPAGQCDTIARAGGVFRPDEFPNNYVYIHNRRRDMKIVQLASCTLVAAAIAASVQAANIEAGKSKAMACGACHGQNGVSVAAKIPNLAGQHVDYVTKQLKAFKDGSRKDPMMNAIAAQLSDSDIDNLAAFWNSLPGASGTAKSEVPTDIAKTRVTFPENYAKEYTYYMTINFPDRKQVRKYYANPVAVQAARAGKPLPHGSKFFVEVFSAKLDAAEKPVMGSDGFFVPDKLVLFTAMETQAGWGNDFPELLRNGDWNYALFTVDKKVRAGVNQGECLACHKPLDKDSYIFTIAKLQAKVK
jgi:cytochrome c553